MLHDLDSLSQWEARWEISFHPDKYNICAQSNQDMVSSKTKLHVPAERTSTRKRSRQLNIWEWTCKVTCSGRTI